MAKNPALGVDLRLTDAGGWTGAGTTDVAVTANNDLSTIDDADNVRQALLRRLNTPKGGLWAHPSYGNPVWDILSEPMSETWLSHASWIIRECINDEPRAETINVKYKAVPAERRVQFTVEYRVTGDDEVKNLVWSALKKEVW